MSGPGDLATLLERDLGDRLQECVHCGFCLPTCPTYEDLGREMDSPRGRLHLIRAMAEGRIGPTPTVLDHLDACLDCRACETACPSGVAYGPILERTRAHLEPRRPRGPLERLVRRAAFRILLPSRRALAAACWPLRVLPHGALVRLLRVLPGGLADLADLTPVPDGPAFTATAPSVIPACGERRGRVGLFTGCVMDQLMGETHRSTVRLLTREGFEVVVPKAQTCCGALHVHNGERDIARRLARGNVLAFAGVETVVVNSAGCGAQLREVGELIGEEGEALARRCLDVTVLLDRAGLRETLGPVARRAVYDEPCHLLHAQGVSGAPRRLLARIPELDLVPLENADRCCGSAGICNNLTRPAMARRLLARKMAEVEASGADLLVTANPGCVIQLRAGVRESGLPVEVVHLVDLLDRAAGAASSAVVPDRGR